MPHDRFYIDAPLKGEVLLGGEEFCHLSRVMRKKKGDVVELFNGKNTLALATISRVSKYEAALVVTHSEDKKPLLPPLKLIQAIPKMSHLELILQKGTEIGASHFYLYPSALSEKKKFSDNQKRRLHLILVGAMKQCGRLDLPILEWGFPSLEGNVFFGDLSANTLFLSEVALLPATFIVGPEKGFTKEEVVDLRTKAQGVCITPYVLRAETAAIAGLAILAQP